VNTERRVWTQERRGAHQWMTHTLLRAVAHARHRRRAGIARGAPGLEPSTAERTAGGSTARRRTHAVSGRTSCHRHEQRSDADESGTWARRSSRAGREAHCWTTGCAARRQTHSCNGTDLRVTARDSLQSSATEVRRRTSRSSDCSDFSWGGGGGVGGGGWVDRSRCTRGMPKYGRGAGAARSRSEPRSGTALAERAGRYRRLRV
jgi:hypothetical protein